ncbi:MAG TPA: hypothetical protein VFN18_04935 [Solirubrobacterales bacterium]|nr:hypothetical protein [Solirubrobacterales bacterium]
MLRTSEISSLTAIALEHERENLRDRRLGRFCNGADSIATTVGKLVWSLVSAAGLAHFLGLF